MEYSAFGSNDFEKIEELQPPGWGLLTPRFEEFIRSPRCQPIKLCDAGRMIGLGTSIFHEDSAWLACIIIHPDYRNRGLGSQITQKLLNAIDREKYSTVFLDATEFGFPVYQKLGFELEGWYSHRRLQGEKIITEPQTGLTDFEPGYQQQLLDLDRQFCNENRPFILEQYLETAKLIVHETELQGFYLPDLGDGLIVAKNQEAGLHLLKERMRKFDYAVLPDVQTEAKAILETQGFKEVKKSRRMYLGKKRIWNKEMLYNRISGQLG